ncbi:hypothetical protein [Parasphingorhabdus litoris]|nr:hypothetical protein [Parasphingorhabdus litoris]
MDPTIVVPAPPAMFSPPAQDDRRYVCEMPPALLNDYVVTMRAKDPQQAVLHVLSFYIPGGWGKGGAAETMVRSDRKGKEIHFLGDEVSFRLHQDLGLLNYYGAEFPCMLESAKV